jgi:methylmalonyl-CoA carboxyltransferase small subunit
VKLNITIDQKTYEVDVEASEPEAPASPRGFLMETPPVRLSSAPAPVKPVDTTPVDEAKVCRSPVSGIVVRVVTQAGQTLQTGDVLLVLEAMKMETSVTAPVGGRVGAVKVAAGDSVQAGQVVVEFA